MSREIDIRMVVCPTCNTPAGIACTEDPVRGPGNHKTRADLAMVTVLRGAVTALGRVLTEDQERRIETLAPRLVDAGLCPRPLVGDE